MVCLKIKDTRAYPSYFGGTIALFGEEPRCVEEEKITQKIADDVKSGILEIVSGNIPANLLYNKQEGF